MTAGRPYFNLSIDELESIHRSAVDDQRLNQNLLDELKHRTSSRAAALQLRVQLAMKVRRPTPTATNPAKGAAVRSASIAAPVLTPEIPAIMTNVPPAHVRTRPSSEKPDEPESILASWIALEALSPQTYRRPADLANGDDRCVANLGDGLPWFRDERSRPKQQLYYQIILGSIPMDLATSELIKVFGEDEERGRREREKAAIAVILVDRNGLLLKEDSVAVSSFAWALPVALTGDLAGLSAWTTAEKGLVEGLTKCLIRKDEGGNLLPLDGSTIGAAFQWLVETLELPSGLYEEPSFVLRVFHYFKSKNPPEVALLNSFFLADLSRALKLVEAGQQNEVLARYVGAEKIEHSPNLLGDHDGIEDLIAPARMPAARWPSPGGHPLVALQQAAVNAARAELGSDGGGIVAVNGPPGTGKTTLLRDIVAACVLDRANAMAAFADPLAAFTTTGQKTAAGDRAFLHLYRLDDSLKGHEVLVASSNNKAVENVSKELPSLKAIGRELRYFRTVSDRLHSRRGDDGALSPGEPTWGLIAAVLGNALNRNAFQQAIWWDDDRSLRLYLKAAKGDSVVREITDNSGQVVRRETPTVVTEEAPPTPEQAKIRWKKARNAFKTLQAEVDAEMRGLETVRKICKQVPVARRSLELAQGEYEAALAVLAQKKHELLAAATAMAAAQGEAAAASTLERRAFSERPGWLSRLFGTARFKRWRELYSPISSSKESSDRLLARATADHATAEQHANSGVVASRVAEDRVSACRSTLSALQATIEPHRQVLGERLVDEEFFQQEHERWNLISPWVQDTLHRKREELFAAALELHRAFIDVSAQKILHNLGVLMGGMQSGAIRDEAKKALLGDLWSTLFLVVPAVSTTFASVDRMLGDLPPSSVGWLLIDEAGQATPQSAVGALMRAKRAIVVGDPLQIPPVVSLPQRLIAEVTRYFNVTSNIWSAPEASVQTVADEATRIQAEFRADVGVRQVGIPLLVHRRCQEPMFGISNHIAYDDQMVYAAGAAPIGEIAKVLGPSVWLDIDGSAESKWCEAEGEAVVQLLNQLAVAGVQQPDVYVITPFRLVAQGMRRRLEAETTLFRRFEVEAREWLRDRVGTIHTFQGKEAEAVIAVLGAPMSAQQGARRWAASTPNILNVMVSRARSSLYVVGSRAAWGSVGHARELASRLPLRRP
jgi:hypothetical protein